MPAHILDSDPEKGYVGIQFEFDDNRVENLADICVRWIPIATELQALERAIRDIAPEYETKWTKELESYWSHFTKGPVVTTIGQPILCSRYMAVGLETSKSLSVRTLVPVVQLWVPGNPRAFYAPRPPTIFWLCRPVDLVAIHLTICRFCQLEFTCRNELLDQAKKEFHEPPLVPLQRFRL